MALFSLYDASIEKRFIDISHKLAREEEFGRPEVTYRDMIGSIFTRPKASEEGDEEAMRF